MRLHTWFVYVSETVFGEKKRISMCFYIIMLYFSIAVRGVNKMLFKDAKKGFFIFETCKH